MKRRVEEDVESYPVPSKHQPRECMEKSLLMWDLIKDLVRFMSARKKFWLAPILTVLLLLGGLIVLSQGSAVAPFIYTLF